MKQIESTINGDLKMGAKIGKSKNVSAMVSHLKDVEYSATGKKFLEACDNMSDVPNEQRVWVRDSSEPNKEYASPEEIRHDLDL